MAKKIETPKGTHGKPRLSSAAIASRLQAKIHEREEANKRDRLRIASIAKDRVDSLASASPSLPSWPKREQPKTLYDVVVDAREATAWRDAACLEIKRLQAIIDAAKEALC